MNYEYVDEIGLLVRQLLDAPHGKGDAEERRAKTLYERGMGLIKEGRKIEAVGTIVEAYQILYY